MVQPNAPRFMREGDNIEFSAKIVNLGDKEMTGQVSFELIDAASNTSVDGWFQNVFPSQYFTVEAGQSFRVKFPMQVPYVLTGNFLAYHWQNRRIQRWRRKHFTCSYQPDTGYRKPAPVSSNRYHTGDTK